MKYWHCFNCHSEKETEGEIVMAFCSCGELMKESSKRGVLEDGREIK